MESCKFFVAHTDLAAVKFCMIDIKNCVSDILILRFFFPQNNADAKKNITKKEEQLASRFRAASIEKKKKIQKTYHNNRIQ